jgi:small nuclear ribonucleoprotein G
MVLTHGNTGAHRQEQPAETHMERHKISCPYSKPFNLNLKSFLGAVKLNANRTVSGVLRGYDQFMNIVLDQSVEHVTPSTKKDIGMVVVRGNSIAMMECIDKVSTSARTHPRSLAPSLLHTHAHTQSHPPTMTSIHPSIHNHTHGFIYTCTVWDNNISMMDVLDW